MTHPVQRLLDVLAHPKKCRICGTEWKQRRSEHHDEECEYDAVRTWQGPQFVLGEKSHHIITRIRTEKGPDGSGFGCPACHSHDCAGCR